jgi:hypothetical protein
VKKKIFVALLVVSLSSCNTPEAVTKFCTSSMVTLKSGGAIFDDMKASCIRETETRNPFGTFPVTDTAPPACEAIGKQAEGLEAVSRLLVKYFTALNDLASFGTSKSGDAAADLAAKVTAQAKLSAAPQKAVASIAGFLTRSAASGYQQKQLANDIVKVHDDIRIALDGLGEAVGVVYLHLLQDEQRKTAVRYREFLLQNADAPEAFLLLDSRWQTDRANFAAKEKAVQSFRTALAIVAKGDDDLAAHAKSLTSKELPSLLGGYSAHLDSLTPAIQKAFF